MSILSTLAKHKRVVIAGGTALALLAGYVVPLNLTDTASAAKGGQPPTNENAYKVCEKKAEKGLEVPPPKKCYGITG
jgi:hypothetical protein